MHLDRLFNSNKNIYYCLEYKFSAYSSYSCFRFKFTLSTDGANESVVTTMFRADLKLSFAGKDFS